MKENQLVKRAQKGDKAAFCELYSLYKDRLYRYAYYKLSNEDDANDAVMDCVLSAFEQITQLKNRDAFCSWIFTILYAKISKLIDTQAKLRQSDVFETRQNDISLSYSHSDLSLELQYALSKLNDDEKDIVLLCTVAGFSSKECAKLVGLTSGSVRSKLSRSLAKMREYLE